MITNGNVDQHRKVSKQNQCFLISAYRHRLSSFAIISLMTEALITLNNGSSFMIAAQSRAA
jgi:hypothetical protein